MKPSFKSFLRSSFYGIDRFKINVNFHEDKKSRLTTCFGSFLSCFILIFVLIHSKNKLTVLVNHEDTRYQTFSEKSELNKTVYDGKEESDFPIGAFRMYIDSPEIDGK